MSSSSTGSRTIKTSLNMTVSLLNAGTTMLVGLFLNPALLGALGSVEFGTWKFCERLLSFVAATEGQASQSLKWTISQKQTEAEHDSKRRDIGSALVVWLRMLPFVLPIGLALAWIAPTWINDLDEALYTPARITCLILVVGLVVNPVRGIPRAVLFGMNRDYLISWLRSVHVILGAVVMVLLAVAGWGMPGVAAASIGVPMLAFFVGLGIARRTFPWFGVSRPSREDVKTFFGFSIWILGWQVTGRIIFMADIIVLGLVTSATTVSSYVLSNYPIQIALLVSGSLVAASMPSLGEIFSRGDLARAARIRGEVLRVSWLVSVVFGALILLWNRSFIALWVGPENYIGSHENLLMILLCMQQILVRGDSNIINLTLDVRKKVYLGVLAGTVSIGMAFTLGWLYSGSVMATLTGLLIGRLLLAFVMPALVRRAFEIERADVVGMIRPSIATLLVLIGTERLGTRWMVDSWLELIGVLALSAPVIFPLAFFLGLNGEQRAEVLVRLRILTRVVDRFRRS